jgi:predicted transcriptional regulator
MKYRSRTDIIAQILDVANGGSTRTKIMYKAFLSHAQMKEYLAELIENGLLAYDQTTQIFKTTERGPVCQNLWRNWQSCIGLATPPNAALDNRR